MGTVSKNKYKIQRLLNMVKEAELQIDRFETDLIIFDDDVSVNKLLSFHKQLRNLDIAVLEIILARKRYWILQRRKYKMKNLKQIWKRFLSGKRGD